MPIGIVSDEEWEKEVGKQEPEAVVNIVLQDRPGRKPGDNNVPDSLRKIIGETAIEDGRQSALTVARMFGISDSSVSAYSKGATSTASYDKPKKSLIDNINQTKRRVTKRAMRTLNTALDGMSPDKLQDLSARNLASIAKDMSAIIRNMEPSDSNTSGGEQGPQFVIFAPQFRDERSFGDTIVMDE